MASNNEPPPGDPSREPKMVRVGRNGRGLWEIAMSDGSESVMCETFEVARRAGHAWATRACPCELIVRDAYGRVVQSKLIDGDREPRRAGGAH